MTPRLFWIPGNVPSSKNSRMRTRSGLFIASKAVRTYRTTSSEYWSKYRDEFRSILATKSKPIILGLHFIKVSKHDWDWINPAQTIQDEMVKAGWIEDDNVHELLPTPLFINGKCWETSKSKPGVYIAILDSFCEGVDNIEPNETD